MAISEQDVINRCLIAIGNDTVSTLDDPDVDTDTAIQMLETTKTLFLTEGYWFNRSECVKLYPDANGKIRWPSGILKLKPSRGKGNKSLIKRSGFIFDNINFTYDLTDIASNGIIEVDVLLDLDFDDLPEAAKGVLMALTVIAYITAYGDSLDVMDDYVQMRDRGRAVLLDDELDISPQNAYGSPMAQRVLGAASGNYVNNPLSGIYDGRED